LRDTNAVHTLRRRQRIKMARLTPKNAGGRNLVRGKSSLQEFPFQDETFLGALMGRERERRRKNLTCPDLKSDQGI
jgi:hypothetical protein